MATLQILQTLDVGMDLIGPYLKHIVGTSTLYLMTVTDYFQSGQERQGLFFQKEVVRLVDFLPSLFMQHKFCSAVISDQGREFCNNVGQHLFQKTGTEHRMTSAYHPQTNGLAEQFNTTPTEALVKISHEGQHS